MMSQDIEEGGSLRALESARLDERSEAELVASALEEYGRLMRLGTPPNRNAFLARHHRIAQILAGCLDAYEMVEGAAGHFAPGPPGCEPGSDQTDAGERSGYRAVRDAGP